MGVISRLKICADSHRHFDAVPRWIWGAPGALQARKVWFYLSKTRFLKIDLFAPKALLDRFWLPKWSQNGDIKLLKIVKKGSSKFIGKRNRKRHPKWRPNGSREGPSGVQTAALASPGNPRETPRIAQDLSGAPRDPPGHHLLLFSAHFGVIVVDFKTFWGLPGTLPGTIF